MTAEPENHSGTSMTPPDTATAPDPGDVSGPVGGPGPGSTVDPAAPTPGPAPTAPPTRHPQIDPHRTRLGGLWVVLTSGAVVLLILLIFILENSQRVEISFFGAHGHLPLGVALLFAAVFGILLVVIPGAGRIIQLRMATKRQRSRAAAAAKAAQPDPNAPQAPVSATGETRTGA